ncbi:4'-phosphopantetheinyl transferase superfamily protein, partial [Acinetobacter baumannii]
YFHPREASLWERTPVAGQEDAWLRTWTRKEAVLKGHGLGLRLILRNLDTSGDAISHASIGHWQAHSRRTGPDDRLMVSVAWPRPATPD